MFMSKFIYFIWDFFSFFVAWLRYFIYDFHVFFDCVYWLLWVGIWLNPRNISCILVMFIECVFSFVFLYFDTWTVSIVMDNKGGHEWDDCGYFRVCSTDKISLVIELFKLLIELMYILDRILFSILLWTSLLLLNMSYLLICWKQSFVFGYTL